MTTTNPTGYCPRCQQNVLLKREEIDTCLAIILLIFTAGIGLLIYLAIYYSKAEDRCIHCGAKITALQSPSPYTYQTQAPAQQLPSSTPVNASVFLILFRPSLNNVAASFLISALAAYAA